MTNFLGSGLWTGPMLSAILGILIPYSFILILWFYGRPIHYAGFISAALFMSATSMSATLPFLWYPIPADSFYFPSMLTAIVLAANRFGEKATLRIVNAVLIGALFYTLATLRWYFCGLLYGGDYIESQPHLDDVRNAVASMVLMYFSATLMLSVRKGYRRMTFRMRFVIPILVASILTTPIACILTYHFEAGAQPWPYYFALWTLLARGLIPTLVILTLCPILAMGRKRRLEQMWD